MIVWRISAERHLRVAFQGYGAAKHPGRWNSAGVAVVYTSATLSLAALELFVNSKPLDIPTALVSVSAEVPDGVKISEIGIADLPENWRTSPAPPALQVLGSAWVQRNDSAVLSVPSAIIPIERNYLLNPAHPDFARIKIRRPEPFGFDARMWKRSR